MNEPSIKKIIIVDDDPISIFVSEKTLKKFHEVEEIKSFTNPNDAFLAIKEMCTEENKSQLPDLMFVDLNMPEMNGWEFIDKLKQLPVGFLDNVRISILTSSVNETDIQKSKLLQNLDSYVQKPLNAEKVNVLKMQNTFTRFLL